MDAHRTLVLMRHAKAEPSSPGGDELRPLSLAGRRQASRAGIALLQAQFAPEVVLCSPAIRTRQTADLAITSLGCRGDLDLLFPQELYSGSISDVMAQLGTVDARLRSVLIVGHEPTMSTGASALANEESNQAAVDSANRGMRTASCAVFTVSCPWDEVWGSGARLDRVIETPVDR